MRFAVGFLPMHRVVALLGIGVATVTGIASCGGSPFEADAGTDGAAAAEASGGGGGDSTIIHEAASGSEGGTDATTVDGSTGDASAPDAIAADGLAGSDGAATDAALQGDAVDGSQADGTTPETSVGEGSIADTGTTESGNDAALCPGSESCVATAPAGWSGPIAFYLGAAAPPVCSGGASVLSGGTGLVAPAPTCSTCTCSGAVTCASPTLEIRSSSPCTGTPCVSGSVTSTCGQYTSTCPQSGTLYVTVQSAPTSASCAPSAQSPTIATATWSESAEGCGMALGPACGTSGLCATTPGANFKTCVYQSGDVACPSSDYTVKQVIDETISDTRACSACACGSEVGVTCGSGAIGLTPANSCGGTLAPFSIPMTCRAVPAVPNVAWSAETTTAPSPSDATCSASGGTPSGDATASGPVTVCCGN
jgi:hypothetical protein